MKKTVIGMVLSLSMMIGVCGCGSTSTDTTVSSSNTQQESTTNEDGMSNEDEKEESKGGNPDAAPVTAFEYEVMSDGTIELTGYTAKNEYKVIEIPEEIDGYTVTALGYVEEGEKSIAAFCTLDDTVEEVIIPDTVTVIGVKSFLDCTNLKSVQMGNGVKEIHGYAFSLTSLESVEIPETTTVIESGAFAACSEEFTIKAPAGSAAETFANEEGYNFEAQ